MSTFKIKLANFFAKNSCTAWQQSRPIRKVCRWLYRLIMETGAKTYPYAAPEFANWPESDEEGKYSLITDSDNFVIRRSPSYISWLMRKTFHRHPKLPIPGKRAPGEHKFDARHWDEVLNHNGWKRHELGPTLSDVARRTHFIGILADEGEFGQLVWFNGVITTGYSYRRTKYVKSWSVTTYDNFQQKDYSLPVTSKVIWYIEPKN